MHRKNIRLIVTKQLKYIYPLPDVQKIGGGFGSV